MPYIKLSIDRLYEMTMKINLEQFEAGYVWSARWDRYGNFLCVENYYNLEDFAVGIDVMQRFGECYKVLIDCLLDFGQTPVIDRIEMNLDKPFSPYAQFFDDCSMSGYQTFEISEWEPFSRGIWYTLGSGNNDNYCWPG